MRFSIDKPRTRGRGVALAQIHIIPGKHFHLPPLQSLRDHGRAPWAFTKRSRVSRLTTMPMVASDGGKALMLDPKAKRIRKVFSRLDNRAPGPAKSSMGSTKV